MQPGYFLLCSYKFTAQTTVQGYSWIAVKLWWLDCRVRFGFYWYDYKLAQELAFEWILPKTLKSKLMVFSMGILKSTGPVSSATKIRSLIFKTSYHINSDSVSFKVFLLGTKTQNLCTYDITKYCLKFVVFECFRFFKWWTTFLDTARRSL